MNVDIELIGQAMSLLGLTHFPPNREEVIKAHRALSLRWHPDKNKVSSPPYGYEGYSPSLSTMFYVQAEIEMAEEMQVKLNIAKQTLLAVIEQPPE